MSVREVRKDPELARRLAAAVVGFRKCNRMTQAELARKARISQPALSLIEKGQRLDIVTLNRICWALGYKLSYLVKFSEEIGTKNDVLMDAESFLRNAGVR